MDEIKSRLTRCFLAVFPELNEAGAPRATPASVKSWDSLATLNLLTVIDEEFNVNLDFVELMEDLSFERITICLQKRVGSGETAKQVQGGRL
jgi:hypothetical protein